MKTDGAIQKVARPRWSWAGSMWKAGAASEPSCDAASEPMTVSTRARRPVVPSWRRWRLAASSCWGAGGDGGEDLAVECGVDGEGKVSQGGDGAVGGVEIVLARGAGGEVLAEHLLLVGGGWAGERLVDDLAD